MARLLFAALSLAVVHGSSYGKVSNSQPWLPLSDGMPLAINEPISGSDSVLMHFMTRTWPSAGHVLPMDGMGHHLQGSAQQQVAISIAAVATGPDLPAPRPASTSLPPAVPQAPSKPHANITPGEGEAKRALWHLPWVDLAPNLAPHMRCSLFWHIKDSYNSTTWVADRFASAVASHPPNQMEPVFLRDFFVAKSCDARRSFSRLHQRLSSR